MLEVSVRLRREVDNSYPILIRPGLLDEAPAMLAELFNGHGFAVVSDSNVTGLYASVMVERLRELGCRATEVISFPAGEQSKNRRVKESIEDRMFQAGLGRDTVVVAVGGGVVGDLAGFVAATFARGVRLVQIPTSLLAMVDSSIGGKTGVDVQWGKNLVGAFHQPVLVLIDPGVLTTLAEEQFISGMAEVVKHGVIRDHNLFSFIENNLEQIKSRGENEIAELVGRNCRIKAAVVAEDEREENLRQILNFGHTVGHAVEAFSDYSWLHGQCVALGMSVEADIACRMGLFEAGEAARLDSLLARLGLPVELGALQAPASELIEITCQDKKARGGRPKYALPCAIGRMATGSDGAYGLDVEDEVACQALVAKGALE
jgi:3-dehydroquinate synthase